MKEWDGKLDGLKGLEEARGRYALSVSAAEISAPMGYSDDLDRRAKNLLLQYFSKTGNGTAGLEDLIEICEWLIFTVLFSCYLFFLVVTSCNSSITLICFAD